MAYAPAKSNGQIQRAKRQLKAFRSNTMQVFQLNSTDNNKAHTLGSTVGYRIDKTGGLAGILFYLTGTVTLSAAGVLHNLGPWNLVQRFRLTLNNNAVTICDFDGFHAYLLGLIMDEAFGADGAGVYTSHAITYSTPVAMGANTVVIPYFIPCSLNMYEDVLTGMVNMQSQTANLNLEVVLASAATAYSTNATAVSLTGELHNYVYELRKGTELPPLVLCTSQQKTVPIIQTGDVRHEVIPQGDLYQLVGTTILNDLRNSADVTNLKWVAGTNKFNYIESPRNQHWQFQRNYRKPAVTGVWVRDFFHAKSQPNEGDFRDIIHTDNFTKLEWVAAVASGATLGSVARFDVLERRVIPLAL